MPCYGQCRVNWFWPKESCVMPAEWEWFMIWFFQTVLHAHFKCLRFEKKNMNVSFYALSLLLFEKQVGQQFCSSRQTQPRISFACFGVELLQFAKMADCHFFFVDNWLLTLQSKLAAASICGAHWKTSKHHGRRSRCHFQFCHDCGLPL